MTNREKFNSVYNDVLADMLCLASDGGIKCKFCCYTSGDCFDKSCIDGIETWLNSPCASEPENPPADKIDKPRKHLPRETLNSKTMINNVIADNVNHPKHYNREGAMECIREMVVVFGHEATINFCKLNAWKYRYRASEKNGAEDMAKSDWYVKKAEELKSEAGYF